jgi:alpha-L-rhamnosidase
MDLGIPYDDTTDPGKFVLFRKTFDLQSTTDSECIIRVSADTRYRLFVNGKSVSFGPCKSYLNRWYFESVDISSHLVQGRNVLSAKVLRFSNAHAGNSSMIRGNIPGFFLHGVVGVCEIILYGCAQFEMLISITGKVLDVRPHPIT